MEVNDYQENYSSGWIKLHRSIAKHWLFENDRFFKWWVLLLIEVNHCPDKIQLGYNLYDINRGQSAKSLRSWSKLFNCDVKQVIKFFALLESDDMISRKILGKGKQSTTLINIENYNTYQGGNETQEGTQEKRKRVRERGTNNKGNNNKNEKKDIPAYQIFLEYAVSKKPKLNPDELKLKYDSWIENDWRDGNDKPIKNWKTKILNTLPYISETTRTVNTNPVLNREDFFTD